MCVDDKTTVTNENIKKPEYPSAEIMMNACYQDYKHQIDTYDKIYEKVNIALGFSGIVLLVIMSSFDYTVINRILDKPSNLELFSLLAYLVCSLVSAVLIIWAVIQLLLLMRSKDIAVVDSIAIRDEELFRKSVEISSVWLIDKYTKATAKLYPIIKNKQNKYDSSILKIVVSLLCYAVVLIIQKGL